MNIFQRELSDNRIYGLDIVRFFAIIFVVISHGEYLIPKEYRYINTFLYIDGVNVFFVLSGFLIGKSLITQITNNEFNIKNIKVFFIRRWAKTVFRTKLNEQIIALEQIEKQLQDIQLPYLKGADQNWKEE